MNKKILVFAVLLILAATIAAGFYLDKKRSQEPGNRPIESTEKEPLSIKQNDIGEGYPKAFPADLLIESGSDLIEMKESETNDGRIQSTIVTTTEKTLVKAVSDYVDYFKTKNWVEIEGLFKSTPESVTATMQYKNDRMSIASQINEETGEKTIRIDITQVSVTK